MKTVFSNKQCVHVWAQQTQDVGRSHSMRFNGTVLYSYNTPVANFIEHKGQKVCLITNIHYSPTTSKNMPRGYDIPNAKVFRVKHIGASGGRSPYQFATFTNTHEANIEDMALTYEQELKTYSRAKTRSDYLLGRLNSIRLSAIEYAKFFGVRLSIDKHFPKVTETAIAQAKERANKETQRKAAQTKEQKAKKVAYIAKALEAYLSFEAELPWDWRHYGATPEQVAIADNHAPLFEAKRVELWREGANVRLNTFNGEVLLRVRSSIVQTSRGAEFPVKFAKLAWKVIKDCKAKGITWQTNGHKIPLGTFQLDSIDTGGNVKAGCHEVLYPEIERLATQLGL